AAGRKACAHPVRLGVCAPLLRRHPFSAARPQQGHRARAGAAQRERGSHREPAADGLFRVADMVTPRRIVVGAHYGLGSWLAQRITAVIMALYSLILLVGFM